MNTRDPSFMERGLTLAGQSPAAPHRWGRNRASWTGQHTRLPSVLLAHAATPCRTWAHGSQLPGPLPCPQHAAGGVSSLGDRPLLSQPQAPPGPFHQKHHRVAQLPTGAPCDPQGTLSALCYV